MITMEIDGLHDIAAGETLDIYANGLHIRISVSSPVQNDAQDIQTMGANDLIVGGDSNVDDDALHEIST